MYNDWFMQSAPKAYRDSRVQATRQIEASMQHTADFAKITPVDLKAQPNIIQSLRMSTAPPIARDRLIGLASANKNLIKKMEENVLPPRMSKAELDVQLNRICDVISKLLDRDLFPWLATGQTASVQDRSLAASIVADRLCGAVADPIVRNAQEARQLALIQDFLINKGYQNKAHPLTSLLSTMQPGTFAFRMDVRVNQVKNGIIQVNSNGNPKQVKVPIDVVIQPQAPRQGGLPVLIEAKSAGDFTNPNKRRKEEATKMNQLRDTFGPDIQLILFLCGYFDSGYLGYEAAEGLDWVWEHRIDDLAQLGI